MAILCDFEHVPCLGEHRHDELLIDLVVFGDEHVQGLARGFSVLRARACFRRLIFGGRSLSRVCV